MKADLKFYLTAIIILLVSFGATLLLPIPDAIRGYFSLPGQISILGIIIEAWRDKRSHERQLELLDRQQDNSLAIASHMANVIFDRQVNFCEAYFEKAHAILQKLFSTGPTKEAVKYADDLKTIRTSFSPWISQEIEAGLLPFEKALRQMGASAQIADMRLSQIEHGLFVQRMYDTFINISGISEPLEGDSPEEAVSSIIKHLRKVMGIIELTPLRNQAISLATIHSETIKKAIK